MDPTYELISEQILTSDQSSVSFLNIPQGYDDLVILTSARLNISGFPAVLMRLNSDSGSKYSYRILEGSGSSATSISTSPASSMIVANLGGTNTTTNTFNNAEIYIPNYTSNINKSISSTTVLENNSTTAYIDIISGLWSDTNAITSIQLFPSTASFTSNSSFYLYGIKNADDGSRGYFGPAATGGDEVFTTGNGYKVHVFKNSGTLNVTTPGEVECLLVGGGGSGGNTVAGGGGAGGVILRNILLNVNTYNVLIGGGGAGNTTQDGFIGSNSSIGSLVANGGGGGGGYSNRAGLSGGSGGGGGGGETGTNSSGGSAISNQGNSGGSGRAVSGTFSGGGGGGGGASGQNSPDASGGAGGNGITSSISGSSAAYAGGGSGGTNNSSPRTGGTGGGGIGGGLNLSGTTGTINTGGGGGGGGNGSAVAGFAGGSGIVIIRYRI